ncbi:MAG: RNA polymerase sigma factor [Saprospiraceae bacterium]|nr:RNA polymerase sigma factor [Saprospiraceae bacterium]
MDTTIQNKEENILILLLDGNEMGLRLLYRNYKESIYGIILNIVKSENHAEEVLNDVFLKFFNNIKSYDSSKSRLFTWMARIARNAAIDKIRTVDFKSSARSYEISNPVAEKLQYQHEHIDHSAIASILQALDVDQKRMIEMVYLLGYTHQECSEELNIPLGTVKTNIRRGLMKLRSVMGNDINAFISWIIIVLIYFIFNK